MQLRQTALMGVNFSPSGFGLREMHISYPGASDARCGGCNAPMAAQTIFIEHN